MTNKLRDYFTSGSSIRDEAPMFGPTGFARENTPRIGGNALEFIPADPPCIETVYCDSYPGLPEEATVALCIVNAQEWIRSEGFEFKVAKDGWIWITTLLGGDKLFEAGDWLGAARWVRYELEAAEH